MKLVMDLQLISRVLPNPSLLLASNLSGVLKINNGSWASIARPTSPTGMNLRSIDFGERKGNLKLFVPHRIRDEGCKEWESCLVGKFIDKKLPFSLVKSIATRL